MAAVVGFAFLVTVATPVGKRIFLLAITTITNAMRCMATTAGMVKKANHFLYLLCEYIENIDAHVTHFLLAEWARDYRKNAPEVGKKSTFICMCLC